MEEAEARRIAEQEVQRLSSGDAPKESDSVIEMNDDEMFALHKVVQDIQERYARREASEQNRASMSDEIVTRFADLGFVCIVEWHSKYAEDGSRIEWPEVAIIGRTEKRPIETDHERKRFDALRTPTEDLPLKHLLD